MIKFILYIYSLAFIILSQKSYTINAQIQHSFDLNCDFDKDNLCLWHNSNITWDHTSDWSISQSILNITSIKKEIAPMPLNNGFIYTNATNNGLNTALLVSDVISCQLGGAEIKYWYYKTQINSRLEICIRQPPGSLNFLHQKCYDGLQAVQANQWVYQKIEIPPFSQPFEILIRAYFIHPDDIIAIDKISYEAALCDTTHGQISVITIDKWNEVKDEIKNREDNIKPMLVIADSINEKNDSIIEHKENELPNNNATSDPKTIDIIKSSNLTKIGTDTLPNFFNVIHEVSPLLTMLWKSLQQPSNLYSNQILSVPSTSSLLNGNLPIQAKGSKIVSIDDIPKNESEEGLNNEENLLNMPLKYEIPIKNNIYVAKINQSSFRQKIYKKLPVKNIYPPNFRPHQINTKLSTSTIPTDYKSQIINNETNENYEIEKYITKNYQLKKKTIIQPKTIYEQGEIERKGKISDTDFKLKTELSKSNYIPLPSYNNIDSIESQKNDLKSDDKVNFLVNKLSEQSISIDDISRQLTPEMINELQMLSNFDDLENLTEGMDLSLLTKPGESVIQGSIKDDAGFILDDEYKSFGTKIYVKDKDKTKFEYDNDAFFLETSPCSLINCNFNNDDFCKWTSLDDNSDIALIFPMYEMNLKEWSLGVNSLGNSVTGIIDNQEKRKNYIYAGDTDNQNDVFILATTKKIFFNEPSRILFDFYHAGIHGEFKVCLDDFYTCPFSYSSNNLTINARKWQKGEVIIPDISSHRILIYAYGLINNYFIGFDNIRLTQLSTFKPAKCS